MTDSLTEDWADLLPMTEEEWDALIAFAYSEESTEEPTPCPC